MTDGLDLWSKAEMIRTCRTIEVIGTPRLGVEHFQTFVHLSHWKFRASAVALAAYCRDHDHPVGVFQVRGTDSQIKNVMFGFATEADRDAFLATPGIIIPK